MGFKLRPGTSLFGNVTFDPELENRSPVLSGINSSYVLTQGQDLIISGSATDPDGDYITWSFEQKPEGSKIIVVGDQEDKVYVYDSSDLSTPISTLSPEGNLFRVGNGVHSDDQYIYVSSVEDTSPRRGIISIYDKNDLSATPITLTPQNYFGSGGEAQYNAGYGSSTLADYPSRFISDGDKLYISNNEIPISRSDNSGLGAYGVVYVYDKTNWSSPPVILNALDNPNAHHLANTKYFGRGFGKAISIYGSNLYVTRGYPSAPDVWDSGFFVYDINDLSATPSYFDSNVDQTTFVDRDWGHRMETTENHIFVSCWGGDTDGYRNGLVYAYNRSDLNQLPTEILSPVSGIDNDWFSYTLHTSEDYLIVYRTDYGSDGTYTRNGLVEIYDINTFNHVTTLTPSIEMKSDDGDAEFGYPMFVSGTNLVIGVQGAKVDNIEDAGTVLIYDLSDLSSPPSQIKEENLQESSGFGSRITMSSAAESVNYSSQGITISQSNNVFTITPGEQSATFPIEFTATDSKGASTSTTSSFEYTYSIGDVMFISTDAGQPFSLMHESPNVILHHDIHANTNRSFSQIWNSEVVSGNAGISSSTLGLNDGIPNSHYSFNDNLVQITLLQNPYEKGTTIKFVNNDLYMTQNLGSGWKQLWNFIGDQDNSEYANFVDFSDADMDYFYIAGGNSYNNVPASWFDKSSNDGWHTHKIQFKTSGYEYYIDDNLVYDNAYVSPGSTWRFVLFSSRGEIKQIKMYGLEVFVDGE